MPDAGSFDACVPRYTEPFSGSSSSGVSIDTVPIRDAAGHRGSASVSTPIWASEQPRRPSAAPGEIATPTGSATTARRSDGAASSFTPFGYGASRSIANPAGVAGAVVSGRTESDGANRSFSQPVTCIGTPFASWSIAVRAHRPGRSQELAAILVVSGPASQRVGIVRNGRRSVPTGQSSPEGPKNPW